MPIDWFLLWLSFPRVALVSTVVALAAGLWIAYVLANRDFRGKAAVGGRRHAAAGAAAHRPGLLFAGGAGPVEPPRGKLWEKLTGSPLAFTWKAAVVAALFHSLPLLVKSSRAAIESIDRNCERAARTLGASEWKLFWRVTLPLARRSIMAATALAFARSLGEFGATLMFASNIPGRTQTIAVAIYGAYEAGNTTLALTLVLLISAIALAILTLATRLEGR